MALTPGTRLGPYEIAAHIGEGGMGEVYRARDTRLDRTVAIKVLPQHVASDPELKQRFEREAKTISSLNHPHICTLHDVGSQDGIDFLVLEYLEGETLAQRLMKGPLPLDQALQYARQMADALATGHRHGIVHRDLKPGNIMLTKSGAKLLDFGLAKRRPLATIGGVATSVAPTVSSPITGAGSIVGTFQYMAPEQLEGKEADARTDIFAFGAVLYEMLTGKRAFEGKSQASLIAAILDHHPQPPSATQQLTPPAVDHVVAVCLAKDPDQRWQSASDLGRELTWIFESGGATAATHARAVGQTWWRRALPLVAASGVVGITVGLVTWSVMRSPAQAPSRFTVDVPPGVLPCCPVIAPDNRVIAFRNNRPGQSQVYIRRLDQSTAVPVQGTEGTFPDSFSPDGQWLLVSDRALKRVPLGGGPAVQIAAQGSGGASWGPDDTIVVAQGEGGGLLVVPASGGKPTPLTHLEAGEVAHYGPKFLPGGRAVLFFVWTGDRATSQVAVYDLDKGERRTLLLGTSPQYAASGHLVFWRADSLWAVPFSLDRLEIRGTPAPVVEGVSVGIFGFGALGAFATANPGFASYAVGTDGMLAYVPIAREAADQRTLVWVDHNGQEEPIRMTPRAYNQPRLSPDGKRVAVDTEAPNGDLFLYDLANQVEEQFTFDSAADAYPLWSPDGSQIYFSSFREGPPPQLYVQAVDGGASAKRVLSDHIWGAPSDWAEKGRTLVFGGTYPNTGIDILTVRIDGDGRPTPLLHSAAAEAVSVMSPNGRWIAYRSNETGVPRIHVRPFPDVSRAQRVVSDGPGNDPLWAPNGRELFYFSPDSAMVVPVVEVGETLQRGTPRRLFSLDRYHQGGNINWDISPDGKRFLMVRRGPAAAGPPQITVVQNWQEELKRVMPAK